MKRRLNLEQVFPEIAQMALADLWLEAFFMAAFSGLVAMGLGAIAWRTGTPAAWGLAALAAGVSTLSGFRARQLWQRMKGGQS